MFRSSQRYISSVNIWDMLLKGGFFFLEWHKAFTTQQSLTEEDKLRFALLPESDERSWMACLVLGCWLGPSSIVDFQLVTSIIFPATKSVTFINFSVGLAALICCMGWLPLTIPVGTLWAGKTMLIYSYPTPKAVVRISKKRCISASSQKRNVRAIGQEKRLIGFTRVQCSVGPSHTEYVYPVFCICS